MGLVTSALTSGRNALISYQGALQVVGNNVAGAGNADYTRQSALLTSVPGVRIGPGLQPGAGVTLSGLKRHVDESLENRLRTSTGDLQSAMAERDAIARVEAFFNDVSGTGISQKLTSFFNGMSDVQNAPDDLAIRSVAIASADALAGSLRSARQSLLDLGQSINGDIETATAEANQIATQLAELNTQIVSVEAGGRGQAGALRDRRDALLRDLSQTFDVTVREQPDGSASVYVGSEPLVQHGLSRGLTTVDDLDGEFVRTFVRFADTNSRINVAGGRIEGMIQARDVHALGRVQQLDQLAAGIIAEVNSIHADGQGLTPLTSVVSGEIVDDTSAPLNSVDAGLRNPPVDGSFFITVSDNATETPVAYRIEVDLDGEGPDTSLDDIVAAINDQVNGVTASITRDQRLSLAADTGFSFTFGHDGEQFREDSSKLLAALGINTFFEGSSAADIAVRQELVADSGLLAAATMNRVGDGINAGRIAGVIDAASTGLNNTSVLDFYNGIANGIASSGAAANETAEAADAITQSLQAQRESISGVSLDEEAIDLLRFERAFQGAARYVRTVDRLMQEMLSLVR